MAKDFHEDFRAAQARHVERKRDGSINVRARFWYHETIKKAINHTPEILECTLRDGSYVVDFGFTARNTRDVCAALDRAGLRYVEVGHGYGLGAWRKGMRAAESDETYLRVARSALRRSRLGAFFNPRIGAPEDISRARDLGLDFIRVGTNVNQTDGAEATVAQAKRLGLEVSFNFMKTYAVGPEKFSRIAARVEGWGADTLCVVDSAGCMLPSEAARYVSALRTRTRARVGFHGHNNLQLAVANTAAAVKAGATIVDSTLRGIGRSAGNAQTEALIVVLRKMGYQLAYDLFETLDAAEKLVAPLMKTPQGLAAFDVVSGMARFFAGTGLIENVCRQYPGLDARRLIVRIAARNCVDPTPELALEEGRALMAQKRGARR